MGPKIRLLLGILLLLSYYILSWTDIWVDRTVHLIFGMFFGAWIRNSITIIREKK